MGGRKDTIILRQKTKKSSSICMEGGPTLMSKNNHIFGSKRGGQQQKSVYTKNDKMGVKMGVKIKKASIQKVVKR